MENNVWSDGKATSTAVTSINFKVDSNEHSQQPDLVSTPTYPPQSLSFNLSPISGADQTVVCIKTDHSSETDPVFNFEPVVSSANFHPPYQLRARAKSNTGASETNWVQAPILSTNELDCSVAGLSGDTIGKTLDLFVLTATRVNQMTKVFYDIDATSLLLEERERDLELAARIGQSLLERNNELNSRNEALEQRLSALNDIVAQLNHKLELKSDLLSFYTQALDSAESEENLLDRSSLSARQHSPHINSSQQHQSVFHGDIVDEDGNALNRSHNKSCSVSIQCDETPSDDGILQTCLRQLTYLSDEVDRLSGEVATKTAEVIRQQNEIESLTDQIMTLQTQLTQSDDDNARMGERLEEATEAQNLLANEVGGMKSRYDECLDLLREAQQEIRALKKRQRVSRPVIHYFNPSQATEGKYVVDTGLDETVTSTPPRNRSSTSPCSLLMQVNDLAVAPSSTSSSNSSHHCACQSSSSPSGGQVPRRISSDCDSDAGYAADSDSMLESLICSPSTNLTVRTFSPCFSSLSSNGGADGTPRIQKSPNLCNRVKIVKDIEGSVIMHRWQNLAHPTLSSSALDSLPGVVPKEQDPVSGLNLHRHNKLDTSRGEVPALSITTSDGPIGCSTAVNTDCECDDDDEIGELGGFHRRCSSIRPAVFFLEDEEELYGDYEVVESRLPCSTDSTMLSHDCQQELQDEKSPSDSKNCCMAKRGGVFINRLAGIHRRKGLQGLNLSPPTSSTSPRSFMTRSVTLPDASCSKSPDNLTTLPCEQSGEQVNNESSCGISFYHPAVTCEGGSVLVASDSSSFASSFLSKYKQFLTKHNLDNTTGEKCDISTSRPSTSQKNDELDETLEEDGDDVVRQDEETVRDV